MAKLLLKLHEALLKEIELNKPSLSIGRKAENDLVIDDPAVSGKHAHIEQIQSVYFIQDAGSSNGTFANNKKIDRKQLVNGDQIGIGQHLLVFQEDVSAAIMPPQPIKAWDSDKTMFMNADQQRDMLKAQQASKQIATAKTKKVAASIHVVSGSTDRKDYQIVGPIVFIGSHDTAVVRLTGWFAPKQAAVLNRLGEGFSINMSDEKKKILVNGTAIQAATPLKDGDLIEVAGITLLYSSKEE